MMSGGTGRRHRPERREADMKREERVVYRERTPWAPWAYLVLGGVIMIGVIPLATGAGDARYMTPSARLLLAAATMATAGAILLLVGGLTVDLTPSTIRVGLGTGWLLHRTIPFDEIEDIEAVTYRPLREFGGWGIRGWGRKKAWTARGNQAVVLHLVGDRLLYVGSDRPARLEERIRAYWTLHARDR